MTPEAYLAQFPDRIRQTMAALRTLVREAAPDAAERVIPGWNIIAYECGSIFCYIGPHRDRAALGFSRGVSLPDPRGLLQSSSGAQHARNIYLTAPEEIDPAYVKGLVQAAFIHTLMGGREKKRRPKSR